MTIEMATTMTMDKLEIAEDATGLSRVDVRQVGLDIFDTELTDEQVLDVLEHYDDYREQDPTGLWCQIIEQQLDDMLRS